MNIPHKGEAEAMVLAKKLKADWFVSERY